MFFIWDQGNIGKNYIKHKVTNEECEEIFFDRDKKQFFDKLHSGKEDRFILLGKTKKDRLLFVVYTMRREDIRVISARDTNRREAKLYEKRT